MKTGDLVTVTVRGGNCGRGRILLASSNGRSLIVDGEELPSIMPSGITVHPVYGRTLALLWVKDHYCDLFTGAELDVRIEGL